MPRSGTIGCALVMLSGCVEQGLATDSGLLDTGQVTFTGCGVEAPIVVQLAISGGLPQEEPGVLLLFIPSDEDGALNQFSVDVWMDDQLDADVDLGAPPLIQVAEFTDPDDPLTDPCENTGGWPVALGLGLDSLPWGLDTPFEAALVLTDSDGWPSEPVLAEGCTPLVDGTPGCGGVYEP